jgi:polyisoprenoid-binding protein YceI
MSIEIATPRGIRTELPAGTWTVDPVHSCVEFQVRNMGIVTIKGFFSDFEGDIELGEGLQSSHATGRVRTASVHTRSEKRDGHLRSPDFFDVDAYPEISFESTRIEPTGQDEFRVVGDLTIKGVTREITLDARLEGATEDPWGGERVGVRATGELDRRDFGLEWDVRTPTDVPLASHKVRIELDLGAVRARD